MPWGRLHSAGEFEEVVQSIKDIGFDGVGIEGQLLPADLKKSPELIPGILKRSNLENGGTYSRARIPDIAWAKKAKIPLFWVSVYEKGSNAALRRLKLFARKSREAGIIPSLHNELRSSFETEDELVQTLEKIPEVDLCLDTAHGAGAGVDCVSLIQRYPKRISLIHLKDLKQILPKSKIRFKRDFVNVGKGALDLKSVVKALNSIRYNNQLMLEIEALESEKPNNAVKEGFEYITGLI
jgi:sugar phosphate isomerase/epimerase